MKAEIAQFIHVCVTAVQIEEQRKQQEEWLVRQQRIKSASRKWLELYRGACALLPDVLHPYIRLQRDHSKPEEKPARLHTITIRLFEHAGVSVYLYYDDDVWTLDTEAYRTASPKFYFLRELSPSTFMQKPNHDWAYIATNYMEAYYIHDSLASAVAMAQKVEQQYQTLVEEAKNRNQELQKEWEQLVAQCEAKAIAKTPISIEDQKKEPMERIADALMAIAQNYVS